MAHPLLNDPFLAAEISRATAIYGELISGEDLLWLREQLAQLIVEEPTARQLFEAAHPRDIDRSGTQLRLGENLFAETDVGDLAERGQK